METESICELKHTRQRIEANDADLSGSTFTNVNLTGTVFNDVKLTGATIGNACLRNSRIEDTNLSRTEIMHANLTGVAITDCTLKGMTIDGILVLELLDAFKKSDRQVPSTAETIGTLRRA